MAKTTKVTISLEILDAIFEGARRLYPKETILMLRGKKRGEVIRITDLVIPPLATYGHGFASYPFHLLPMDLSLVGTVHSHPSGNKMGSDTDFNNFFGRIMMIVGYPYKTVQDVVVYNGEGEQLQVEVTQE
jgi:proteasome lid subunit RPN8/RPN11